MRPVVCIVALAALLAPASVHAQASASGSPTAQPVEPRGPQPGANSFAEGQARAAVAAQGYEDVSPLVNDSQGIWRGTARKGQQTFNVSVDYKGHVDAQ